MTYSLRIVLASIQNTESGAYLRYVGQGKVMYVMSNRREERRMRLSLLSVKELFSFRVERVML